MMTLLAPWLALAVTMAADDPATTPTTSPASPATEETWSLPLGEAIRLGLVNSPIVRVVATGPVEVLPAGYTPWNAAAVNLPLGLNDLTTQSVLLPPVGPNVLGLVLTPVSADTAIGPFRAALMAHVRSVEQQYWALAQMQVTLTSREGAVRTATDILERERAELTQGRATAADVAEAEQQLENFKLNLITAQSDLTTTERQLRNILGLPRGENRRIIPSTPPLAAKLTPEWEASLAQMMTCQPDVVTQREALAAAALKDVFTLDAKDVAFPVRAEIEHERDRQLKFFREITHQTTHSLARFFLEVDANYKQYQTAQRLKAAASKRLGAQRAFYDEGRVTLDRLLDAVSQAANATAQEAQHLMSYNTSIAAFEEAKGTLLDFDGITVALPPRPQAVTPPPAPVPTTPATASAPATPTTATTYKVRASVAGVKLIDVEVEKTAAPAAIAPK